MDYDGLSFCDNVAERDTSIIYHLLFLDPLLYRYRFTATDESLSSGPSLLSLQKSTDDLETQPFQINESHQLHIK